MALIGSTGTSRGGRRERGQRKSPRLWTFTLYFSSPSFFNFIPSSSSLYLFHTAIHPHTSPALQLTSSSSGFAQLSSSFLAPCLLHLPFLLLLRDLHSLRPTTQVSAVCLSYRPLCRSKRITADSAESAMSAHPAPPPPSFFPVPHTAPIMPINLPPLPMHLAPGPRGSLSPFSRGPKGRNQRRESVGPFASGMQGGRKASGGLGLMGPVSAQVSARASLIWYTC